MPMQFVESRDEFSVYRDTTTGRSVYMYHRAHWNNRGGAPIEPGLEPDDALRALADEPEQLWTVDRLTEIVSSRWYFNPSLYGKCDQCGMVEAHSTMVEIDGEPVCEGCRMNLDYAPCVSCDDYVSNDNANWVGSGWDPDTACSHCYETSTSYCDYCDHSYWEHDADDHQHREEGASTYCCTSPMLSFSIPTGMDSIPTRWHNDTRLNIDIASGVVNDSGMEQIRQMLYSWAFDGVEWQSSDYDERRARYMPAVDVLHNIGREYKTADGAFAKRLKRHLYNATKDLDTGAIKLPDDLLAKIGAAAADASKPLNMSVEITRDVNQYAEDFVHEGSCWWTEYDESRCTLKSNGGYGLRDFDANGYPIGRSWVIPVELRDERLTPTFADDPDGYIVFNGYGTLSERAGAATMAAITGMNYAPVAGGWHVSDMYVNGGSAYVVGPEHMLELVRSNTYAMPDPAMHAVLDVPVPA